MSRLSRTSTGSAGERALAFLIAVVVALVAVGCGGVQDAGSSAEDYRAVWDSRLVALAREDDDAVALARSLEEGNDPDAVGGFTSAEAPGDGTVVVTYTVAQAQAAYDDLTSKLDDAQSSFAASFSGCTLEVSDDYRALTVRLTEAAALEEGFGPANIATCVILAQHRMVQAQLLSGSEEPWSLTTELYDADDGRLIATYEDEFSLDYEFSDWEVSD